VAWFAQDIRSLVREGKSKLHKPQIFYRFRSNFGLCIDSSEGNLGVPVVLSRCMVLLQSLVGSHSCLPQPRTFLQPITPAEREAPCPRQPISLC
jgi:hypothetical protein